MKAASLNGDSDIDWVTERSSTGVDGLPGAFINTFGEWRSEQNLDRCLRPCTGGIKSDLCRRAQGSSSNVSQAVISIPVTGAAVLHQPLLVQGQAEGGEHIIWNGEILDERKVVGTIFRVYRWKNRRQRSGFDDNDFLCRMNNECWFNQRGREGWRTKGG